MKHIVYKTYNPSTGEYYFGKHSTNDIHDGYQGSGRWVKENKQELLTTNHLYFCETEEESFELEEFLISLCDTDPLMKNLTKGGNQIKSRLGSKVSKEGVENIRKSIIGRKQSEESKKKKSEALIGRKRPDGFGEALSKKMKGVPKHTEEGKEKLRIMRSGLDSSKRLEIKRKYKPVYGMIKKLAAEYGVSTTTLSKIIRE